MSEPNGNQPPDGGSVPGVESFFPPDLFGMVVGKAIAMDAFMNALVHDHTFKEFVREILLSIMKVVKCEAGSVLEVDYKNQVVFFRAAVGSSSEGLYNFTIPIRNGIVGHVIESKQHVTIHNIPENLVHLKSLDKIIGFEVRNLTAYPILIRGRVFGVIELLNRIGEAEFTTNDIELLTYLSEMAAKAIEIRMMIAWNKREENNKEKVEAR